MQPDNCPNSIEGLKSQNYIPLEFLPFDVSHPSQASQIQDAYSIVELGKQLIVSAKNGDTDSVRDLMCRGAPFTTDWLGTSALHFAAQNNHLETAEVLLRAGISRDARTKVDRTPLHMAAYEGHHEMAFLLLNYGADVDSRDMLRMTPLHWAVEQQHIEVIKILLEHGADPNSISKFDKTPISLALEISRIDFVAILQQEREFLPEHQRLELEEATQNLIKLDDDKNQEIPNQFQSQKRKLPQVPLDKKKKIVYLTSSISDDEQEKEAKAEAEIAERMSSIENSTFKNVKTEFENIEQPLRLLQAHGITMIPVDNDTGIVENAMESGRTVVLTEAGKLALNLTKVGSKKGTTRKLITIQTDKSTPVISTSRSPNILKKIPTDKKTQKIYIASLNKDTTKSPISHQKLIRTNKSNSVTLHWAAQDAEQIINVDSCNNVTAEKNNKKIMDIDKLNKELMEARKTIAEYRKKFQMKVEEAESYKQQLRQLLNK